MNDLQQGTELGSCKLSSEDLDILSLVNCSVGVVRTRLTVEDEVVEKSCTGFVVGDAYLLTTYDIFTDVIDDIVKNIACRLPEGKEYQDWLKKNLSQNEILPPYDAIIRCLSMSPQKNILQLIESLQELLDSKTYEHVTQMLQRRWKWSCDVSFQTTPSSDDGCNTSELSTFSFYADIPFVDKNNRIIILKILENTSQALPRSLLLEEVYQYPQAVSLYGILEKEGRRILGLEEVCQLERRADHSNDGHDDITYNQDESALMTIPMSKSFVKETTGSPFLVIDTIDGKRQSVVSAMYLDTSENVAFGITMNKVACILHQYTEIESIRTLRQNIFGKDNSKDFGPTPTKTNDSSISIATAFMVLALAVFGLFLFRYASTNNASKMPSPIMVSKVAKWEEIDKNCYTTKAVTEITRKIALNTYNYISITGMDGSGKLTAVRHAALHLKMQSDYTVYPVTRITEFIQYFDPNRAQVFVFEDPVWDYSGNSVGVYDKQSYDHTAKKCTKSNSKTKVVVVLRNRLYFDPASIIFPCLFKYRYHNIDMDKFELTREEMKGIMTLHLQNKNTKTTESLMENLFSPSSGHRLNNVSSMYPLLSKVYIDEPRLRRPSRHLFADPIPALIHLFNEMKTRKVHLLCGLVLCSVFKGELPVTLFTNGSAIGTNALELRGDVMALFGFGSDNLNDVKSALTDLGGTYVTRTGHVFQFTHFIFRDIITYLYKDTFSLFEFGSMHFISDKTRFDYTMKENKELTIVITKDEQLDLLAKRLIKEFILHPTIIGNFLKYNTHIKNEKLLHRMKQILAKSNERIVDKDVLNILFTNAMISVFNLHVSCLYHDITDDESLISDYELITLLIEVGADTDIYIDSIGCYPIHLAILIGRVELVEKLIHHGADVTRPYNKKIFAPHVECIEKVKEVETTFKDCSKHTPVTVKPTTKTREEIIKEMKKIKVKTTQSILRFILRFWKFNSYKVAKLLLEEGADVNSVDKNGESLLHNAIKLDKVNSLQFSKLLIKHGANVNSVSDAGESLLHYVLRYNNAKSLELAKLYISHGAIDSTVQQTGESVLHYLVKYNNNLSVPLGQLFLDSGFDPNALDKSEIPVLHTMTCCQDSNTIKLAETLIDKGANVNIEDSKGQNVLHHIIACNRKASVALTKLLLRHGANTNAVDRSGVSVLHYLAYHTNDNAIELATMFLKFGADVEFVCRYGGDFLQKLSPKTYSALHLLTLVDVCQTKTTVLHLAALNANPYAVKLSEIFLEHGADVNAIDKHGDSVLYYAFHNDKNPHAHLLAKLLITRGARTDRICDKETYFRAVVKSNKKFLKLLSDTCSDF